MPVPASNGYNDGSPIIGLATMLPRLPLVLILLCLAAGSVLFVRAKASYKPGVATGDTVTYEQVSANWVGDLNPQSPIADFLNVSSIQNTVTSVNQNNVTLHQVKTYNNGTTVAFHLLENVQSGYANYTPAIPWAMAKGLAAPEAASETPQAPTITQTVEKVYLGTVRIVNVIVSFQSLRGGYVSTEQDYDQQTGILLYLTITLTYSNIYYVNAHLNILITQTNLWSTSVQPDYAIYANPFTALILKGSGVNSTVALQSLNNFIGAVSLSETITPAGRMATLNQTLRSVAAGETANVLLSISTSASTPAGKYAVNVTATSGSLSHSTIMSVTVVGPSYSLTPAQAYIAIPTNSSGTDEISLSSLGRFNGTITLSAFPLTPGPVLSVNPSTITVKAGTNTTTLTITTHQVPAGYYSLKVNGTGPIVQPAYVYLQVLPGPPDFTISLDPPLASYDLASGAAVTHVILTSINGFTGTVNLDANWINGSSDIFIGLSNPYLNAYQTTSVQVKVFSPPISTGCCGTLEIIGTSGSLNHSANFSIYVPSGPDFTVSVSPVKMDVPQGITATANVTLTNIGSITGPIGLSAGVLGPFYGSMTFSPNLVTLAPGQSSTAMFQISSNAPTLGTFNFTVYAFDIGHSHNARLALTILSPSAGFSMTNSGGITIQQGSSSTTNVVFTSTGNFYCNVTAEASSSDPGLLLGWTVQRIDLSPNATSSLNISISASGSLAPGFYSIALAGSCNGILHTTTITIRVVLPADFNVTVNPSLFQVQPGGSTTITVTLNGVHNFNGTLSLSAQISETGPLIALSSQSVVLTYATPTASTTLTISLPESVNLGSSYTITVNATDGTQTHGTSFTVTVANSSGNQSPRGAFLAYAVAAGVLAASVVGLLAFIVTRQNRSGRSYPHSSPVDNLTGSRTERGKFLR